MRKIRVIILRVACVVSILLCALLVLVSAGIVRPGLGVGWGDPVRGRAYSIEADGAIVMRTAAQMKPAVPGMYAYGVQMLAESGAAGIRYQHWNITAGRAPGAPVLGTFAQVNVALSWPLMIAGVLAGVCVMDFVKDRRLARESQHCRKCGYDLRATRDRCPECGTVPEGAPAG